MARPPRPPRVPPPERFEVYVCRTCGAFDWVPELAHNGYCPGRRDAGHIDRVLTEP